MSGPWLLFLLCSLPLPHECVRKVRSVQKSREVIYHLRMIAPCAMKAIRFNACIHAAPKSFAYFAYLLFFLYVRTSRLRTCTTLIFTIIKVQRTPSDQSAIVSHLWHFVATLCRGIYGFTLRLDYTPRVS